MRRDFSTNGSTAPSAYTAKVASHTRVGCQIVNPPFLAE